MVKPNINKEDYKRKHPTKGRKVGSEKAAMIERMREKEKKGLSYKEKNVIIKRTKKPL